MITKGKQNTTHDGVSIGSTIRQNIVEKLPVINTQVKLNENKEILLFFLLDSVNY